MDKEKNLLQKGGENGMTQKPLLDKQKAAEILGISINTLNRWIVDRKINYIKAGKLVKFRERDIVDFEKSHLVMAKDKEIQGDITQDTL